MAPPVPVMTQARAQQLFGHLKTSDCVLKELTQYECVLNGDLEIICLPFTRLFQDCMVHSINKKTKKEFLKRQMLEITTKDTNLPRESVQMNDLKDFLRANAEFKELQRFAKKGHFASD